MIILEVIIGWEGEECSHVFFIYSSLHKHFALVLCFKVGFINITIEHCNPIAVASYTHILDGVWYSGIHRLAGPHALQDHLEAHLTAEPAIGYYKFLGWGRGTTRTKGIATAT